MEYIKTEIEQQFHADMLRDVYKILKKNNIPAILTNGALLSAYKIKDLFPHAMGAVLSTFRFSILPKDKSLIKQFVKAGFRISKHYTGLNYKIRVKKGKFNIEIVGYTRGKDYYYRQLQNKKKIIPLKYFDKSLKKIKLRNTIYVTVSDIEGFLSFIYNDWKADLIGNESPSTYKSNRHMVIDK